ncbi:MAG: RNA-guided endonuclease TnpB family protein [Elainellaceae cyanobacterium]
MPRSSTPTFTTLMPLIVDSAGDQELRSRFNAGMRLLNACLGEGMIRVNLVKNSDAYQAAKRMPKGTKAERKARSQSFGAARKAYRFTDYDLQEFACQTADASGWMTEKLDKQCIQKLATRAFMACDRVLLGKARGVRFKVPSRFRSMEGKSNKQGIRFKDGQFVWGKLKLKPLIDKSDPIILHGLSSPIKYVRILRKELNGKMRYFAQLINEGDPFQKPKNVVADGLVGLDLNVSVVGVVGDKQAELMPLADQMPTYQAEIARLQRQMERSRRIHNPDNFEPDFQARKGRKTVKKKGRPKQGNKGLKRGEQRQWIKTKRYLRAARRKHELERRKAAYAQSQNRKLANDVLRIGNVIKTERVSVKGWQKRYGKAIAAKSPGFFMSELARKAERAGGQVIRFSTQTTALSQTHLNGERFKKSLCERVHRDVSGFEMHRDLFSAFLSRHVVEDELLLQSAQFEFDNGLEAVLMEAWQRFQSQNRKQVGASESRLAQPPLERFSIKPKPVGQIGMIARKAS